MMVRRQWLVPAYLFACLMLGGSTQTVWLNALLQLVAVAILAWAALERQPATLPIVGRRLAGLAGAMVVLVALHLVPLPPVIWSHLPGRAMIGEGLALLGLQPGWQSLSLAPYDTIATVLPLLPPLAMLAAVLVLRAYSKTGIVIALLAASLINLVLGILQIGSGPDNPERFYLQPEVNAGTPSGMFANPNHMASLMLVTLPFLFAFLASSLDRESGKPRRYVRLVVSIAGIVTVVAGLLLNRSLAGLGLLVPVLLVSAVLVIRVSRTVRIATITAAALSIAAFALVLASPLKRVVFHGDAIASIDTRGEYLRTSLAAAADTFPFGSGIGTFQRVYRMHEDPRTIDATIFVNHAHDDYIELLVEAGLPAVVLILLFLAWWGSAVRAMLTAPTVDDYAKAGAIASAALLLHSLVDFPLRTSALSVCFALAIGLIVGSRRIARSATDLWRTRHVEIGGPHR